MRVLNTGTQPITINLRDGRSFIAQPGGPAVDLRDSDVSLLDDSTFLIGLFNAGTLVAQTDAGAPFPGFPTTVNATDAADGRPVAVQARTFNGEWSILTSEGRVVGNIESALQRYGAVFNNSADDADAIQQTADWFAGTFPRSVLRFPNVKGLGAVLGKTIQMDMALVAADFSQLTLRPAEGVTAFQLTGTDPRVHSQSAFFLRNFHIRGPGRAIPGTRGIFHHRADGVLMGPGASRYQLENFSIADCDVGEEYGNTAWGIGHSGWSIFECGTAGIKVGAGYVDGYELPVYGRGALLNNINGITLERGQLTFKGSSLDYNRFMGTVQQGRIHMIGCHVETNKRRNTYGANHVPWVISNNGAILMKGGRLVMTDGEAGQTMLTHWFDNQNTSALTAPPVFLDAVSLQNIETASGYLGRGPGAVIAHNCVLEINGGAPATSLPIGVHESRNELVDGGFEALASGATNFFDTVYVRGGTMSNRATSTTVSIAVSDQASQAGTKCLRATKLAVADSGNAGQADIYILKRVSGAARPYTGRIHVRSPASTAQIVVQFGFFQGPLQTQGSDVVMVPSGVVNGQLDQSGTFALSGSWAQRRTAGSASRAPAGYEWVGWRVRLNNLAQNDIVDIDGAEIHAW